MIWANGSSYQAARILWLLTRHEAVNQREGLLKHGVWLEVAGVCSQTQQTDGARNVRKSRTELRMHLVDVVTFLNTFRCSDILLEDPLASLVLKILFFFPSDHSRALLSVCHHGS